jgi:DNA-binding response OmpR family regulator
MKKLRRNADRTQAMAAGAMAFLPKPFDSAVLLATIEAARHRFTT